MNTEMQRRLFTSFVRGLFVCLLGSSGFAVAAAITEDETPPGNIWSNPQVVEVPAEGLTISGRINLVADVDDDDVDYFAFEADEGDTLSIAIVGALKPTGPGECDGFPANIALYDTASGSILAAGIGECGGTPEPSFTTTLATEGQGRRTFIIGVSADYNYLMDAGETAAPGDPISGGPYQLVISGVTPVPPPPPRRRPPPPPPAAAAAAAPAAAAAAAAAAPAAAAAAPAAVCVGYRCADHSQALARG